MSDHFLYHPLHTCRLFCEPCTPQDKAYENVPCTHSGSHLRLDDSLMNTRVGLGSHKARNNLSGPLLLRRTLGEQVIPVSTACRGINETMLLPATRKTSKLALRKLMLRRSSPS